MFTQQIAQPATGLPTFQPVRMQSGKNGPEVASARELYDRLGFDSTQWARWHKKNIVNNPFAKEGEDWIVFDSMSKTLEGGRPTTDYVLTIDFAKRLCMLARTYQGEAIRRYFIQCERELQYGSLQNSQIAALVGIANSQTEEIIGLKRQIALLRKDHVKAFRARVIERHRKYEAKEYEKYVSERDAWRIKFLTFLDRYCKHTYGDPDKVLTEVYKRLKEEYGVYLSNHRQMAGESWLDVAYRIGYGQQTWEILAYKLRSSAFVTMPAQ